jgi:DNA-binding NarL/FixJ family response regulator
MPFNPTSPVKTAMLPISTPEGTPARIRVIVVDDHNRFRVALRNMLESDANIEIVGEATDGPEAIRLVNQIAPDIVCMDLRLPILNGVEATRRLRATHPSVKIIGLSGHEEQAIIEEMLDAGAVAYVPKANVSDDLVRTIRAL